MRKTLLTCMFALAPLALAAQGWSRADSTAQALADAGFTNVRAVQTDAFTVFTIENDERPLDGAIYNLRGQRVENPTKGLYIINGKKVVIK